MKKTIITLIVVVGIAALVAGGLAIKKYHDIVTPDNILAGLLKEYEITFGDAGVKVLDEYNENAFMDPFTVYRFSLEGGDISGTVLDPEKMPYSTNLDIESVIGSKNELLRKADVEWRIPFDAENGIMSIHRHSYGTATRGSSDLYVIYDPDESLYYAVWIG